MSSNNKTRKYDAIFFKSKKLILQIKKRSNIVNKIIP